MSQEYTFDDPVCTYHTGLLGATANHPGLLESARLEMIERRILSIEAALFGKREGVAAGSIQDALKSVGGAEAMSTEDQIAGKVLASRRAAEAIALDEWRWREAEINVRAKHSYPLPSLYLPDIIHEYRRLVREDIKPPEPIVGQTPQAVTGIFGTGTFAGPSGMRYAIDGREVSKDEYHQHIQGANQ